MKTCSIEAIAAELTKRFADSDTPNECQITMKHDGTVLSLTLCSDGPEKALTHGSGLTVMDFDWILVGGKGIAHTMGGKPGDVCRQLQQYAASATQYAKDVEDIKAYCAKHANDPEPFCESAAYEFYSDWHKDLFGHRPIGWTVNARGW